MKALVTGGAGFIGSHIVRRLLDDGHEVVVLDHRVAGKGLDAATLARVHAVTGDACDAETVTAAARGCDRIFAFAALVGVEHYAKNRELTMQVEDLALKAACAAALANDCSRLVYPSSSAVYGNASGLLSEDSVPKPTSHYAAAKYANELYLQRVFHDTGLKSVALRIFNVYGPGQDERLVIPRFVRCALQGEGLVVFNDGRQRRDFPYIDDVVLAAMKCAEIKSGFEVVNVASGQSHSIRELAEMIIGMTGNRSRIEQRPLPEDRAAFEVERSVGDVEKLRASIGFVPSTPLELGLAAVIRAMSHA